MYTMTGTVRNGNITLDEPINGWEGQQVLVTILEENNEESASPTLEEVVAAIRSRNPNPANVIQPTESLADLLADVASEPPIDSAAWNKRWAAVEAEMKRRDLMDDRMEGRL